MSFDFFAFDSRFFWEDVYNYNDWVIQLNVRTLKYRLVDPLSVSRESGSFDRCKETLLKYISACELEELKDNTVIILHGFGKKRSSITNLAKNLKDINANIIALNYATLRRGLVFHSNILAQMLQNTEIRGKLYIINNGASCLITRKFIGDSDSYRRYNIERILDINPMNSGSDLAELLKDKGFFKFFLGPMLKDIATSAAVNLKKLPDEIDHGIIIAKSPFYNFCNKIIAKFESFPFSTPPSERSYAAKLSEFDTEAYFPLNDEKLILYCKNFITTGDFGKDFQPFHDSGTTPGKKIKKNEKKSEN